MKENLFLFFEEIDDEYDISSHLVRIAMNRFIIDENDQYEVTGLYYLKKMKREIVDYSNPAYKTHAKARTEKDAFDKDLISDAIDQALINQTSTIGSHFIFGSLFHLRDLYAVYEGPYEKAPKSTKRDTIWEWYTRYSLLPPTTPIISKWISNEIKNHDLNSLRCTWFHGIRSALMTHEKSIAAYEMNENEQSLTKNNVSPFNNDLEESIEKFRNDRHLSRISEHLFLHKMLTRKEIQQVRNNKKKFWRTLANDKYSIEQKDCSIISEGLENQNKFIWCECERISILWQGGRMHPKNKWLHPHPTKYF